MTTPKRRASRKAIAKPAVRSGSRGKLRRRTEPKGSRVEPGAERAGSAKIRQLVHELQVHQVELEVQNEELRRIQVSLLETQASLEESRNRYRGLYDFSPVGHLSVRANGTIADPNRVAMALLGVTPDGPRRRTLASFIARRDRRAWQELHRRLLTTGVRQAAELELVRPDRSSRRVRLEAVVGPARPAMMALISMIDLTELRAVQDELEQRTQYKRAVLYAARSGIIASDESGRIESVNPAIETIFGYAAEELIGRNVRVLMASPYREEHDDYLARYRRTGVKRIIGIGREVRGRRKDGSELRIRLAVSEVHQEGHRIFVGFVDDLSAEERLEGQLRDMAQQAALAESRERRRLAEDLHDGLGQTLALAKVKLGMLRETASRKGESDRIYEIEKLLGEAHEQATSLTFQLSPPVLDDLGLVAGVRWLADDLGRRFALDVAVEDDGEWKPLAEAVQLTLFRSLRELLINVAKHAKTGTARVRTWTEAGSVHVVVEDDGVGFDPDATNHGFGLFSTRQRLQHVGGVVRIESIPGDGTKVHMSAPLAVDLPRDPR